MCACSAIFFHLCVLCTLYACVSDGGIIDDKLNAKLKHSQGREHLYCMYANGTCIKLVIFDVTVVYFGWIYNAYFVA